MERSLLNRLTAGNTFTYNENGFHYSLELRADYQGTLNTMTVGEGALRYAISPDIGRTSALSIPRPAAGEAWRNQRNARPASHRRFPGRARGQHIPGFGTLPVLPKSPRRAGKYSAIDPGVQLPIIRPARWFSWGSPASAGCIAGKNRKTRANCGKRIIKSPHSVRFIPIAPVTILLFYQPGRTAEPCHFRPCDIALWPWRRWPCRVVTAVVSGLCRTWPFGKPIHSARRRSPPRRKRFPGPRSWLANRVRHRAPDIPREPRTRPIRWRLRTRPPRPALWFSNRTRLRSLRRMPPHPIWRHSKVTTIPVQPLARQRHTRQRIRMPFPRPKQRVHTLRTAAIHTARRAPTAALLPLVPNRRIPSNRPAVRPATLPQTQADRMPTRCATMPEVTTMPD